MQVLRSLATRSQRASAMRSGFVKFGFVVGDEGRPQKHSMRMFGCGLSCLQAFENQAKLSIFLHREIFVLYKFIE